MVIHQPNCLAFKFNSLPAARHYPPCGPSHRPSPHPFHFSHTGTQPQLPLWSEQHLSFPFPRQRITPAPRGEGSKGNPGREQEPKPTVCTRVIWEAIQTAAWRGRERTFRLLGRHKINQSSSKDSYRPLQLHSE